MAANFVTPIEDQFTGPIDRPEPEYLDGVVVERSMPQYSHSKAQRRVCNFFGRYEREHQLYGCPELRVQVAPNRIRVVDFAVYASAEPSEQVPSQPPLVAVEIVSPDDRYEDIIVRFREYRDWGVRHIWLVDPWSNDFSIFNARGLGGVPYFELPEYSLTITAADIFE